ncbi:MAG: LysE family translocator [Acidobacteriota bacterium]
MNPEIWIAYVATVLVMMSTPGPSHLLMLSNSMASGFRRSIATAAGDLTANVLQMLAAGLGLAAVLTATRHGFTIVKWCGVAYLVWLGVQQIRRSLRPVTEVAEAPPASVKRLWLQGFVTSAANPKAVVFFAALFPQFLSSEGAFWPQMLILGATYIAIDAAFLLSYGASADWLASKLRGPARRWLDRLAGSFLIGAAVLLGLKTVQRAQ